MRPPIASQLGSPAAVGGITVAILLLLALGVIALRGGDERSVGPDRVIAAPSDGRGEVSPSASPTASSMGVGSPGAAEARPSSMADHALPAGTCVVDDGRAADVGAVQVVDCSTAHTGEVYAATVVAQPAEAPYPDPDSLAAELRSLCQGPAFAEYVGTPWDASGLFSYALMPTAQTWAAGDRDVACVVYDLTEPLTGSVRGTAR